MGEESDKFDCIGWFDCIVALNTIMRIKNPQRIQGVLKQSYPGQLNPVSLKY